MNRQNCVFTLFALLALLCPVRVVGAAPNPMVHRDGMQVVDGAGRPIHLRGVNLSGWYQWEGFMWGKGIFTSYGDILSRLERLLGPDGARAFQARVYAEFITEEDFAKIAALGFNSVRILVNRRLLADDAAPDTYLDSGWAALDRTLSLCAKYRLYAVIDLHAVPGGQSMISTSDPQGRAALVWNSEDSRARTVALWRAIARRYADNRTVAAYDLINEPLPDKGEDLVALYRRIVDAIRAVDKQHMIMLEGGKLATDFSMFDRPLDPNQIYSFHMYTWFGDNRAKKLDEYRAAAESQRVPFWAGEFGENTYDMIGSTLGMYENADFVAGWSYFPWKRAPTKYPGLATFTVPKDWEKVMNWIASAFAFRPGDAVARQGIDEFFQAVALKNCQVDRRTATLLIPPRAAGK